MRTWPTNIIIWEIVVNEFLFISVYIFTGQPNILFLVNHESTSSGRSINVNIFMCTNHTLSGVCENQHFFLNIYLHDLIHFFCTLLTFWTDFYYFHGDFWHAKNVEGRGGALRKCIVCILMKMLTFMDGPLM